MKNKLILTAAAGAFALVALAGCSSSSTSTAAAPGAASTTSAASAAPAYGGAAGASAAASGATSAGASGTVDAQTASTSLGTIVVNGAGMTAYFFDKDTKGASTSACTGGCATAWPEITTNSSAPTVEGITGTVGTITGVDGKLQITINGLPIYTYAADTAPGQTSGQGFGGIWHVIGADGSEIMTPAAG
ncbi:COG4315 family predicted lipoprotein [Subtercola endophyticus]|uniref:COG4315 family predicted lipoprotein n=1 Tax=Subtercola endophyticus TaxID=2895559 RepID=UPI001E5312D7|nr:hypothetical protein [Subtercola endophyticus]UFS58002.1 hypothetical protein LQ955_13335 [Subtercola endophyticus]